MSRIIKGHVAALRAWPPQRLDLPRPRPAGRPRPPAPRAPAEAAERPQAAPARRAAVPEAERIVAEARRQAEALLAEARARAEALREEARAQGHAEGLAQGRAAGLEEGREQAAEEARGLLAQVRRLADEALRQRDAALARAEEDVLKLALAVAEKVIGEHAPTSPQVAARALAEVLPRAAGARRVTVRAHPSQVDQVRAAAPRLLREGAEGLPELEIVPDPGLSPGGIWLETEFGALDARLETRLAEVGRALLDVMRDAG